MTTELEQEFFKVFGIKPKIDYDYKTIVQNVTKTGYWFDKEYLIKIFNNNQKFKVIQVRKNIKYPEITDRKLLQLLCIYNDMQDCIDLCITPCKYEDAKEMILQTLVNEKNEMIDCEKGTYMDVMTKQIQQLFKEEE